MTITATFSNGYTDAYKGTRSVTAAWMITRRSDGKILASGHSLDRPRAQKTAEGNIRDLIPHLTDGRYYTLPPSASRLHREWARKLLKSLREAGKAPERATPRAIFEACRAINADTLARARAAAAIEIIDL